ncbi:MAG: transcriptional regulator [Nitrosopumilaceae archaeon]
MPEIWLNYGVTDAVLDIKAENLEQQIGSQGTTLSDSELATRLDELDISKPIELVILNYSESVRKIVLLLFEKCNQQSLAKPHLLVDKSEIRNMRNILPDGVDISQFSNSELSNSNLVFINEIEFDGLFGFDTVSAKLARKFGQEHMLSAYEKRKGNLPAPGEDGESLKVAQKFSNKFEISAVEVVANSNGIIDLAVGHPSSTSSVAKSFVSIATNDVGKHRTLIISTGKESSNNTLGKSLSSLWNCYAAIKEQGLAILLAECKNGVGSDAIQQYIEGRMSVDRLKNPAKYVDGMEDLLFLTELEKKFQVGIVSVLPKLYTKKLEMIPFDGIKFALDHILKTQGAKQKVTVVSDGARVLLR